MTTIFSTEKRLFLKTLAESGADHSEHPTVVEYAVRFLFKKKSPAVAAKMTAQRLGGSPNLFIGGGLVPVHIDPKKLENAIYERMVQRALEFDDVDKGIRSTLFVFYQSGKRVEKELTRRVMAAKR
jgi:hypothetical protein